MPSPSSRLYTENALNAALGYASIGWPVLPAHGIADGRCTCDKPGCKNPGKHPLTPNGLKDATTDDGQIRAWLTRWPEANLALATGQTAGIWVLDVDGEEGLATIARIEAANELLPGTLIVRTGGGGYHFYYTYPRDGEVKTVAPVPAIGPGVDARGKGGYVIVPPSRHYSGNAYAWDQTRDVDDAGCWTPARTPVWLQALVREPARPAPVASPWTPAKSGCDIFPEGGRNSGLTSLGGSMRRAGMAEAAILAALLVTNREQCRPPLDEDEVGRIAKSVSRYPPVTDLLSFKNPLGRERKKVSPQVVEAPSGAQFFGGPR